MATVSLWLTSGSLQLEKQDSLLLCWWVFLLALCLWKNRPQQKNICIQRNVLPHFLVPVHFCVQHGSSSVDVLSLGFR